MKHVLIGLALAGALLLTMRYDPPVTGRDLCIQKAENHLRATRPDWREMARVVCP